jgi:lipoate synthase
MENLDAIKIRRITDVEEIEKVCSGRDIICDFCNFEEVNSQRTMDDVNEKWRLDTHIDPSNTASIESGLDDLYDLGSGYFMKVMRLTRNSPFSIEIFHHENDGLPHTTILPRK